ncbi:MFS transporter [Methylibium petroleiphilum]|uniref:MFS transporter n=1 Tax=Methylibium petroleiphilum TaxID=105560 RepID=UPI003D2CAFEF
MSNRGAVVAALGIAQTLAWGSTYYLPAVLAPPMAKELGVSTPTVFAAFSVALIVSALLGPHSGRSIDRWGGRPVLMATNVVFASGLTLLSFANGPISLFLAWIVVGVGMGCGLYEAAFATLVRLYGHDSRNTITGITLIAGFASTVGWPLSSLMEVHLGWRGACLVWAAVHLLVAMPLNWSLPKAEAVQPAAQVPTTGDPVSARSRASKKGRAAYLLAFVFAVTWFISTAMAAHLPTLLQAGGVSLATAIAIGALVGPAQVAGRLLEFGFLRRVHPLLSARLAALLHPLGAVLLAVLGAPVAAVFAVLHGAGNGVLTIAKGTLPLVLFGPQGYGHRQGLLMIPARIAQALAPWLFGVWLNAFGAGALWISSALGLLAFFSLVALKTPPPDLDGDVG